MSIRITGQAELGKVESTRPAAPKSIEADSTPASSVAGQEGADQADISNASQLVQLAKTLTPAGKQEKLSALAARVGSGAYRPAAIEVSRSIVQGLLKK